MVRAKQNLAVWIVTAVVLAALDVWLLLWVPGEGSYKSPLAVPVITFFLLLMIFVVFSQLMNRKLLEEMQTPGPESTPAEAVANTVAGLPVPQLRVEVLTSEQLPAASPAAAELVARSGRIFQESVAIQRKLIWYLIGTNLVIALGLGLGWQLTSPLPIWFTLALIAAAIGRRPSQNSLSYLRWFLVHVLWLGLTLFVGGAYLVELAQAIRAHRLHLAAILPPLLVAAALLGYAWRLPRAVYRLRREVLSHPPLKLLFLWVFGSAERLNSLFLGLGAIWRCLGTAQLLEGGEMLGTGGDVFRYLRGRTQEIIARTPEHVAAKVSSFQQAPHRWMCMYATNMLLCGDQSWRYALDTFLKDTDLVLMDLSRFSRDNAGCTYEIGQLIDKIDNRRFLFLIDDTTDLDFLYVSLEAAWKAMAADSPNRQRDDGLIRLFRLGQEYVMKEGDRRASLEVVQKDAACVMRLLCEGATTCLGRGAVLGST